MGTQGASSTQAALTQGTPREEEKQPASGASSAQGASDQGTEEQPASRVTLRNVSSGFLRGENGRIVLESGWTCFKSWLWLIGQRDRVLNEHPMAMHGCLGGAMQ